MKLKKIMKIYTRDKFLTSGAICKLVPDFLNSMTR